tara:strand:- start:564 stop:791 length:228 start_codon:yes stop_codon:yes gene_type:complete
MAMALSLNVNLLAQSKGRTLIAEGRRTVGERTTFSLLPRCVMTPAHRLPSTPLGFAIFLVALNLELVSHRETKTD